MDLIKIIIDITLVLAAIIAVIYTAKTFRKDKLSRRALIAPVDDPGYLRYDDSSENGELLIKLKNFGINPANNICCSIIFFNSSEKEDKISICSYFDDDFYCFNPLPHLAEFNIQSNRKLFLSVIDYALVGHILLDISYVDKQLNKKFKDRFVWTINIDGRLFEVSTNVYNFMKNFSYDKEKLKEQIGVNQLL